MQRGTFTPQQTKQLLQPIRPNRVLKDGKGHSHVSQQDITAHLIRMFGFGNFDIEVLSCEPVFEMERTDKPGRYDVCYRGMVRITVRNAAGEMVAFYENGSTATAQNQTRGDGHDLAYKSAISLSIKRAAIALGDQFGLSLYNKGQMQALVLATLVGSDVEGDVQANVPQQVSLGNDEIDSEPVQVSVSEVSPPSPAPDGWRGLVADASTVAQLTAIHSEATTAGWLDADVKSALTARKKALVAA